MAFDRSRVINGYTHSLYADQADPTCRRRYLITRFYPTLDQLRTAGMAYNRSRGAKPEDLSEAGGLFQPMPYRSKYDKRTKTWLDTTPPLIGIIRLTWEYIDPEVIAHEATHAALHTLRLHAWSKHPTDETISVENGPDEEIFCYLVGRIVRQLHQLIADVDAP